MAIWGGVAKQGVERYTSKYQPEDPFYEYYKDDRGKQKRRKRNPPPGLTPHEEKVWRKIAKHAHRLDRGIRICGFRFGYTAILGIFPYVGTAANAGLNYYLVTKPAKEHFDLPPGIVSRMQFNTVVGCGVDLIPLVGDVILAAWGANARNVHLVEGYLAHRAPAGSAPTFQDHDIVSNGHEAHVMA